MRHRDQYEEAIEFDGTQVTGWDRKLVGRVDEGTDVFNHFHKWMPWS